MGINQLTSTPWHLERYERGSGDDRRHRSRCVYLRKQDLYCSKYIEKCRGSAHCPYYIEKENEPEVKSTEIPIIKPKTSSYEFTIDLSVGCRIYHMVYGWGNVQKNQNGKITVQFDHTSEKTLDLDVCMKKKLLHR